MTLRSARLLSMLFLMPAGLTSCTEPPDPNSPNYVDGELCGNTFDEIRTAYFVVDSQEVVRLFMSDEAWSCEDVASTGFASGYLTLPVTDTRHVIDLLIGHTELYTDPIFGITWVSLYGPVEPGDYQLDSVGEGNKTFRASSYEDWGDEDEICAPQLVSGALTISTMDEANGRMLGTLDLTAETSNRWGESGYASLWAHFDVTVCVAPEST